MSLFKKYFIESLNKIPLDKFNELLITDDYFKTAIELLGKIESIKPNSQALIVGGSIRDIILGKPAHDIDIATNIDVEELTKHFKTIDIGKSRDFGILNIKWGEYHYEVANYRTEGGYSDNRRPDQVTKVKSFEQDSARRDLTFNALGLNRSGTIIDHQNGIEDLKNKIVKTVGNAQERFIEDSLRILRVARFAAKFGFQIEAQTRAAMVELSHLVDNVSAERIHDELIKTASVSGTVLANFLEHLNDTKILQRIMPELVETQNYTHFQMHHPEGAQVKKAHSNEWEPFDITNPDHQDKSKYDLQRGTVWDHIMAALRTSNATDPITNLAILFHDIGKPVTAVDKGGGKVAFPGHETAGMPVFTQIANRLKFSNVEKKAILFAMEHHMKGHRIKELGKGKVLALRQDPNWPYLKDTMRADDASRGQPLFNAKEFHERLAYIEHVYNQFGETQEFERKMSALVDGKLIIGLIPGIQGADIGRIKNNTRDWIISKEFQVTPEEVKQYILALAK